MILNIHIKDPVLRSFARSIFEVNSEQNLVVSNTTITGSVICSVAKVSNRRPPDQELSADLVTFEIPVSSSYTASMRNYYLVVSAEGERVVNNVLRHEFNTTLLNYCNTRVGRGIDLKTTLYDFLSEYDLIDAMNYESIRKRHSRAWSEARQALYRGVRNSYYYLSKKYSQKK